MLQEAEAGSKVAELCRRYGIGDTTYYNWKAKCAGMTVSDLRQMVAEQALDNRTSKELLTIRLLTPEARKAAVMYVVTHLGRSIRNARNLVGRSRVVYVYVPCPDRDARLRISVKLGQWHGRKWPRVRSRVAG